MKINLISLCFVTCYTTVVSRNAKFNSLIQKNDDKRLEQSLRQVFETNECRSVVLMFPNGKVTNVAKIVHNLQIPIYAIEESKVHVFNGPYHKVYHEKNTIEESKIYLLILPELPGVQRHLQKLQEVYFWRARDRVLVVIEQEFNTPTADDLKQAAKLFWKKQIINAAFIFSGRTSTVIFTYNPFPQISLVPVNDGNVFYEKMANLMGHRINISMFKNVLDAIPSTDGYLGKDGILAKTVMGCLNASYSYIAPSDSVDYGENHNRQRITGAFGDLVSGKTEVAFNSRYLKDEFQDYLEATYPHGRDDLTCLVPMVREMDVKNFLSNFSFLIWLTFLVVGVICALCLLVVTYFSAKKIEPVTAITTVIAINLGQQAKYLNNITPIRMTLLLCVFIAFFFNSAYQTRMTSLFTVPIKPKQLNTLKDLAESDLKIYTLFRFKKMLNRSLDGVIRDKIVSKLVSMQEEEQVNEINEHKNYGVICKDHIATYAVIQKENFLNGLQFYRIMNEKPMPSIVCYTVR